MALVCDTSGIYALYDADDANHEAVKAVLEDEPGPLFVPVAELDYLLSERLGVDATLDFLASLENKAFTPVDFTGEDLIRCRGLIQRYADLPLGLADASVIATAERLRLRRILTLDRRHFRIVKPAAFDHFTLLPADRD